MASPQPMMVPIGPQSWPLPAAPWPAAPFRPPRTAGGAIAEPAATPRARWRDALPTIAGARVTLRDLRLDDAAMLLAMVGTDEVTAHMGEPPRSVEGFEQFITWAHRRREEGAYLCFGVVPSGEETAVGFFQIRPLDVGFQTAEWGFALGRPYWGTGLFREAAGHALRFVFDTLGTERLQARAVSGNQRCHAALRGLGAVRVAVLRGAFRKGARLEDEIVWSLTRTKASTRGACCP